MPPPSGRAVSHVWSYFTKEPTENPDIFLCTCQICESQGVKPLVSYSFTRGGGTGSFNKHLVKKHGITKETHATSDSGTTSGNYIIPKLPYCIHRGCNSHQHRKLLQSGSLYVPPFL
ncbi:uncharacterized protein LOC130824959 [Amaranthus tricolor]|uniref:uncharacterized protein LOC130824959 n=1 Tax=Amaranthus tricolor TaxID=29722 RepID=UPI00258E10A7|nr:uncharacterized protein LOC130824959 [Amaranthus tricolor]